MTQRATRPGREGALRVAVIGCGAVGTWSHLRNLRRLPGATLVAAADPDPVSRTRAAKLTGAPVVATHEEVLARADVDAVVLCTPTELHAALALQACAARKHFYLEKPIATNAEDARRVLDAAAAAGVVAGIGFNYRLHPVHEHARTLLIRGRIGPVRAVQTAFCEPAPPEGPSLWRRYRKSGGGVLLDLASHHVDLLRWLLADEVARVEARVDSLASEQDAARLTLTTRDGVQAQCLFTCRGGPTDRLELVGERGTLRIDRYRSTLVVQVARRFGYGARSATWLPTREIVALRLRRLVRPSHDPSYRRALAAFVDRVRGRPSALPTLEDGARSLAVVLAAEASARTGAQADVVEI